MYRFLEEVCGHMRCWACGIRYLEVGHEVEGDCCEVGN